MKKMTLKLVAMPETIDEIMAIIMFGLTDGTISWAEIMLTGDKK